jgi:hypothetical protein
MFDKNTRFHTRIQVDFWKTGKNEKIVPQSAIGSRLVKSMRKQYKANDDGAKLVFSTVAHFREEIPALAAAVLSGYGSH